MCDEIFYNKVLWDDENEWLRYPSIMQIIMWMKYEMCEPPSAYSPVIISMNSEKEKKY